MPPSKSLPNPLNLPIDDSVSLQPTRILHIPLSNWSKSFQILDLTAQLLPIYPSDFTPAFQAATKKLITSPDPPQVPGAPSAAAAATTPQPIFTLSRTHFYSDSHIQLLSSASPATTIATFDSPLLSYGTARLRFPPASPHSSHDITVAPVRSTNRARTFVKDSVMYVWEAEARLGHGCLSLFRVVSDGTKREIAKFESERQGFGGGGVVVIDEGEVDLVVAVLSLVAIVRQRDAFSVAGLDFRKGK